MHRAIFIAYIIEAADSFYDPSPDKTLPPYKFHCFRFHLNIIEEDCQIFLRDILIGIDYDGSSWFDRLPLDAGTVSSTELLVDISVFSAGFCEITVFSSSSLSFS